uniref:F-box domain-containing protein n=1 Tax=Setaria italica TaxID=4555 RepID=K4A091_SETIT
MAGNRKVAVGGRGDDRLSDLPDGILEHVLSVLPAADAVRSSVLSRRWLRAWAHAPALNLSDERLQDRFLGFAREVLARYGAPDVPALNVTLGCESNLGPAAATAWLRDAMERVVSSVSVSVMAPGPLCPLTLPRGLRAKSITLVPSGISFQHGPLVLPGPDAPTSFGALTELSLSRVRLQERVRPLGEFLSSCCPRLRKLLLSKVSGGLVAGGGLRLWPLVLHLDMLEELVVDRVESFNKLQVVSANLRVLGVHSCFGSVSQWGIYTVVEISAPRLEHLSFLNGSHCIRCLSGLLFYLPGNEFGSTSAELDHVPQLPNIRVLSLRLVAILRFINCPIAPIIFSFLKRCPNLTRLHIDLSMLHQFSRLDPEYLTGSGWKACRDQLELGSLREIRISGFTGTDCEMELADVLFGVGVARPALERISIALFPQVRQGMNGSPVCCVGATSPAFKRMPMSFPQLLRHMDSIGTKMKAQFPLVGGYWETVPRKELTWTRTC